MPGPDPPSQPEKASILRDSQGWDGKLRVEKRAVLQNPEVLSDPDVSDEDAPPVEEISADEGTMKRSYIINCSRLTYR